MDENCRGGSGLHATAVARAQSFSVPPPRRPPHRPIGDAGGSANSGYQIGADAGMGGAGINQGGGGGNSIILGAVSAD